MTTTVLRLNSRGRGACAGAGLQLDLDVLHVGELHAQAVRPGVVDAEVHPGEVLGRDLLELLPGGSSVAGFEEAVREYVRQGLGDVTDPGASVVSGAAVKPNPARVEMTRPPVTAAFFMALALICGSVQRLTGGR
ncbi:hypothetical protein [Streptomyces viridosporus]|uniref:hypothetical protein n=1 Tax=Streptomyces viridosporus TaxID=67581 RepID=UPI0037023EA4